MEIQTLLRTKGNSCSLINYSRNLNQVTAAHGANKHRSVDANKRHSDPNTYNNRMQAINEQNQYL